MKCIWCDGSEVTETTKNCYWIMPDGKRAIEIINIPALNCNNCGSYLSDEINHEIDMALYARELNLDQNEISYQLLMKAPYKRIDFLS